MVKMKCVGDTFRSINDFFSCGCFEHNIFDGLTIMLNRNRHASAQDFSFVFFESLTEFFTHDSNATFGVVELVCAYFGFLFFSKDVFDE